MDEVQDKKIETSEAVVVDKPKAVKKPKVAVAKKAEAVDGADKKAASEKKPVAKKELGVYYEGVGRRKTSVARVRLFSKGEVGTMIVNGKKMEDYFTTAEMRMNAADSLNKMKVADKFYVSVIASGGGIHSQSEAVRHGIARALIKFNADFRKRLKKAGFLTRDQRTKERRKFGLKKARKAPQWSKR